MPGAYNNLPAQGMVLLARLIMPVYTYQCENCGVRFEHTAKFVDPPLTRCPECGKKSLRKVYLPVGIVFKGSGFYATDHRSPSGQSKFASGESKPAESSKSGDESGSSASSTPAAPSTSAPASPAPSAPAAKTDK